jgi:hypothetical protein
MSLAAIERTKMRCEHPLKRRWDAITETGNRLTWCACCGAIRYADDPWESPVLTFQRNESESPTSKDGSISGEQQTTCDDIEAGQSNSNVAPAALTKKVPSERHQRLLHAVREVLGLDTSLGLPKGAYRQAFVNMSGFYRLVDETWRWRDQQAKQNVEPTKTQSSSYESCEKQVQDLGLGTEKCACGRRFDRYKDGTLSCYYCERGEVHK